MQSISKTRTYLLLTIFVIAIVFIFLYFGKQLGFKVTAFSMGDSHFGRYQTSRNLEGMKVSIFAYCYWEFMGKNSIPHNFLVGEIILEKPVVNLFLNTVALSFCYRRYHSQEIHQLDSDK